MAEDRRRHARISAGGLTVGLNLPNGQVVRARAFDLSQSGIGLVCDAASAQSILAASSEEVVLHLRWLDPLSVGQPSAGEAYVTPVRAEAVGNGRYHIGFRQAEMQARSADGQLLSAATAIASPEMDKEFNRIVEQIGLKLPDHKARAILITAGVKKEGVSTIAWWLSTSLAEGYFGDVLYLDTDSRLSRTGIVSDEENPGLLELVNEPHKLDSICSKTAIPNLSMIRAWSRRSAGMVEVTDQHVAQALTALKQRFSYILIDAQPPAVSPLTLVLARHSDGVFLVINPGKTDRDRAVIAADLLRRNGAEIIGAVMNHQAPGR